MQGIQHIDSTQAAEKLASLLNGNARHRPVVVVTTPADRSEPWIDVEKIARDTGSLADVFLMETGAPTWEFARLMPEGTGIYGGFGRVYPQGHDWTSDLNQSPLRIALDESGGTHATSQLISDAFRMAATAGLLQSLPTELLTEVRGKVALIVAGRALVDIGSRRLASIAEELTIPGLGIERIVAIGQQVTGSYDSETNRLDITRNLRTANDALDAYSVGDVILTKVAKVRNGKAELVLYPKTTTPEVTTTVYRVDVTSNPADDLRTLMTIGEVIPARVTATGPDWSLILKDVDDDEPIVIAPSLIPSGPPWLIEESGESVVDEPTQLLPPVLPTPDRKPEPVIFAEPIVDAERPSPPSAHPTPAILDRNRRVAAPPQVAPPTKPAAPESSRELARTSLLKIDELTAENSRLSRERSNLQDQNFSLTAERETLRYLLDQAERRANRAENDLKNTKSRLRRAGNNKSSVMTSEGPKFADPETGFRYLVLTQWATRTLLSEQSNRPLPDYVIGPKFLDSLNRTAGITEKKVADVVFEILTGIAAQNPSREVHRLRIGPGGDDPGRTRSDGAVAWRASLQVNTPSARRIHYWVLPSGEIELAYVGTHDDYSL